ncbi:MAG: S1C family serine protease [Minwuia sp.]|uniref:S1C family serine protease n=1 Tax=Minwuia sp. TaxID=2493630 RepID=UPI003A8A8C38
MKLACDVGDRRIEKHHLECLDYHARAWRRLMFRPDLGQLSLRNARLLREACAEEMKSGPAPWARCVEQQMAELRIPVAFPDLSALTAPDRNRIRQMCEQAAQVSSYREAACLEKLRDRFMDAPGQPEQASPIHPTNTRQSDHPAAERMGSAMAGAPRVAALTPGILNYNSLDPSDPFWPSWRGLRPDRPLTLSGPPLSPDKLYEQVASSVHVVLSAASIEDFRASRNVKQGSAVAVSKSHLATNCHVLKGAAVIVLLQGERNGRAKLLLSHPATDRCLLESIDMPLVPTPGVRAFEDLKMGEKVWSIAAPHGLQQTLHDGIVSQLRSNNGIPLIQTSAHAAPGSSGGGLFDSAGNLVGITNFTVAGDVQLHFAIAAAAFWQ